MAWSDAEASGSSFFRLFVLLAAVALGSDRLGTIDLPRRGGSIGVFQCRAIVPNGSVRRGSVGVFGFRLFCLLVDVVCRLRSIGDNRWATRGG